jgi:hypothetical protein
MDSPHPSNAVLILQQTGQAFSLDQDLLTIGRKSGNTIVLADDLKVSRHHTTISRHGNEYVIEDVGSANGTYVNSQRLEAPQVLKNGDVIQMGDTVFTVSLPVADTQPTLKPALLETDQTIVSAVGLETDTTVIRREKYVSPDNPYVGPRTFTQQESNRFFGREREAQELFSLVISERLVLFYAQSGAGKSSLINARLVPQLRQAGFPVLPIGRVSGELPQGMDTVDNLYIFNLLLSMDESDGPPKRFTQMTLSDFLIRLTSADGQHYYYDENVELEAEEGGYEASPYVMIIDQFEEILTTHPERWEDREVFFRQLSQAMVNDPYLWVVLTLREDYVAPLDPYVHLLPGNLRARFYMQRMGHEAALEAIQKPAEQYGRPFAPGVAESLVDNLRQIRIQGIQSPGQAKTQSGQFVEPVQLQVVCFQLWENLKDRPASQITEHDLRELGDVDTALAQFYEQAIVEAAQKTGVSEIDLRNWFETELITEAGTRGTVYRGADHTGGLPNHTVDLLADRFLLRAEVRTGGTWYELVHDRFIDPILQANRVWGLKQPLIQMAQDWEDSGRNINKLLEGQSLKEALASNWKGLGPLVEAFLTASQEAQQVRDRQLEREREAQRQRELEQVRALAEEQQKRAEDQAKAAASLRKRAILLAGLVFVALLMAIAAAVFGIGAVNNAQIAKERQQQAEIAEAEAIEAQQTAQAESMAAAANAAEVRKLLDSLSAASEAPAPTQEPTVAIVDDSAATLAALVATLTAQPTPTATATPTATNTPTPTPPATATPTGVYTPPAALPPTETPPPTSTATATTTPTPDTAATATLEAIQLQIAQVVVQVTATAAARSIPPSPTVPICTVKAGSTFEKVWNSFKDELGCPRQLEPVGGAFAEQLFQKGFMFWTQILDVFIVFVGNEQEGEWRLIKREEFITYSDEPACQPLNPSSSPDLIQPIRGFGGIWCDFPEIQKQIGWGITKEYGIDNDLIQQFEQGMMLRTSNGATFVLLGQKAGRYQRVN